MSTDNRDQHTAEQPTHPRAGAMHTMDALADSETFRKIHDAFELQPSDDGENLHIKCRMAPDCPGQWVLPVGVIPDFKTDAERAKFAEAKAKKLAADLAPHVATHVDAAAKSPS
jgi:hypothetical protein